MDRVDSLSIHWRIFRLRLGMCILWATSVPSHTKQLHLGYYYIPSVCRFRCDEQFIVAGHVDHVWQVFTSMLTVGKLSAVFLLWVQPLQVPSISRFCRDNLLQWVMSIIPNKGWAPWSVIYIHGSVETVCRPNDPFFPGLIQDLSLNKDCKSSLHITTSLWWHVFTWMLNIGKLFALFLLWVQQLQVPSVSSVCRDNLLQWVMLGDVHMLLFVPSRVRCWRDLWPLLSPY